MQWIAAPGFVTARNRTHGTYMPTICLDICIIANFLQIIYFVNCPSKGAFLTSLKFL